MFELVVQLVIAGIVGYIAHLAIFCFFDTDIYPLWLMLGVLSLLPNIGDDEDTVTQVETKPPIVEVVQVEDEPIIVKSDLSTTAPSPAKPAFESTDTFDYSGR